MSAQMGIADRVFKKCIKFADKLCIICRQREKFCVLSFQRLVSTDIERRLILALINIERTKPPDFFFGVYSFLSVMRDTRVSKLPFTARDDDDGFIS